MCYSVVIPTFKRNELLTKALHTVVGQSLRPLEIIVVDNSPEAVASCAVSDFKSLFMSDHDTDIIYIHNNVNSGAVARNLGVRRARGEFICFLDDDVELAQDYYEIVVGFLKTNSCFDAAQGYDFSNISGYQKSNSFVYLCEKLFQTSFFYEQSLARIFPSLCISVPAPDSEAVVTAEWVSTCAGVFRAKCFERCSFDNNFVKYSWNEYVDLSLSLTKAENARFAHLMRATFRDVQTNTGRLPNNQLIMMSEVYDSYIFRKQFHFTPYNYCRLLVAKFGRVMYRILSLSRRSKLSLHLIKFIFFAPIYSEFIFFKKSPESALSEFHKKFIH